MSLELEVTESLARRADPPADAGEALARARELAPGIRARAAAAEDQRRIPDKTIAELQDSGLFQILTPKLFGGAELGVTTLLQVTMELAAACGSTGWVYGVLAGHSWMLNLLPEAGQREVLANPRALTATVFRLNGEVEVVDGGYRLKGAHGRFCSGIDFADWVMVGNAVKRSDGSVEPRFFVVSKDNVEVVDDWFTTGMRGTGSRSIRIGDAFIPAHRSISIAEMSGGRAPGAALHGGSIYRMSFADVTPFSIAGAPLGMARGALALTVESLRKSGGPSGPSEDILVRLAEAAAAIDAAERLVLSDARMVDGAALEDLSRLQRASLARNWAYAARLARGAINQLFELCGGSTIYLSSDVQRLWRDANSAAQHRAFSWSMGLADYGRALLNLDTQGYKLKSS
jgi:3-hydroxy-9,10-secoandrosta-1,3,5(10)-triene-9,17-dione monooxygenase